MLNAQFCSDLKRGHGNHAPSKLRGHGVTIFYAMCPDSGRVLPVPNVQKWTLARARTTNEQREKQLNSETLSST